MAVDRFTPIVLPGLSQDNYSVGLKLAGVPTLSELTARLGALPREALIAAIQAEPAIYDQTVADARDASDYLQALAASFSTLADRLQGLQGGAK